MNEEYSKVLVKTNNDHIIALILRFVKYNSTGKVRQKCGKGVLLAFWGR